MMTFTKEELEVLEGVPIGKREELMSFARYLKAEHKKAIDSSAKPPVRHGGWVEGEIWMSDDFDDPMDFVSSEEMKVLEDMRGEKLQAVV